MSLNFENNFVITLPDVNLKKKKRQTNQQLPPSLNIHESKQVFATYHQLQKADLKLVLSEMPFLSKITLDGNPCAQARPELRRGERRHSLDINSFLATPLRMPDETNVCFVLCLFFFKFYIFFVFFETKSCWNWRIIMLRRAAQKVNRAALWLRRATYSFTRTLHPSQCIPSPLQTLIKASSSSSSTNGGPSSGSGDPINDEWSAFLPSKVCLFLVGSLLHAQHTFILFVHKTYEIEPSNKMYNEATKPMIEELSTDTYDYIQHYFGKGVWHCLEYVFLYILKLFLFQNIIISVVPRVAMVQ